MYFVELENFDGDGLTVGFVVTLEHVRTETRTDHHSRVVDVVFYFFDQFGLLLANHSVDHVAVHSIICIMTGLVIFLILFSYENQIFEGRTTY